MFCWTFNFSAAIIEAVYSSGLIYEIPRGLMTRFVVMPMHGEIRTTHMWEDKTLVYKLSQQITDLWVLAVYLILFDT